MGSGKVCFTPFRTVFFHLSICFTDENSGKPQPFEIIPGGKRLNIMESLNKLVLEKNYILPVNNSSVCALHVTKLTSLVLLK